MADNTQLNLGAGGDLVATDDIGGVKYQRVKLSVGADGSAVDAIGISAALDSTGSGIQAVGIVAQFDDTAPASVTENQFAAPRISSRRALLVEGVASGTDVNVKASANSGVDIGDVTINNAAGAAGVNVQDGGNSLTVDNDTLSVVGGGLEATALRVTIASDSTGVLSIDDNGTTISIDDGTGSITIDGTVTANLGATDTGNLSNAATSLAVMDDWDNAASDGASVSGDVAHDSADAGEPVKVGGKAATALPTAVAANDRTNLLTDVYGRPFVRVGHQGPAGGIWTVHHVPAANTVATITQAAAGAGVRNVCTGLTVMLVAGATAPTAIQVSASLIDGAAGGTTYLWRAVLSCPATAGATTGVALSGLWLPGTANTGMTLEFSAAGGANTVESVSMSGTTVAE